MVQLNSDNKTHWTFAWTSSNATVNTQPTKDMNAGSHSIAWADPNQPSINPATRREQYNLDTILSGGDVNTGTPRVPTYNTSYWQNNSQDYLGVIRKLPSYSYFDSDVEWRIPWIQQALQEEWIDTTIATYWKYVTDAAKNVAKMDAQLWQLKAQKNRISSEQSSNAELVYALSKEVWSWLALWKTVQDIAKQLWQDEWVIQKIVNWQEEELIELNQWYADEQLRSYVRAREDYDIQRDRNVVQFQNIMKNLNYEFDTSMQTLKRQLFDSEWEARTTSANYWMTWTKYLINRIETQYRQNMDDLENTYNYQSANAQIALNNALEDYYINIKRRTEDYNLAWKWLQWYVLQNLQNVQNNIWLTNDQIESALLDIKTNVLNAQDKAMQTYLTSLESWNIELSRQIAQTYWLSIPWAWTMRTERNNNPTAMTTDVAKSLGAVEWVDYIQWDSFKSGNWATLYTARLLWDPVETTIRIFDNAASKWIPIFYTQKWAQRWSHTAMSNEQWMSLSKEKKKEIIAAMLQREWWSLSWMSYYATNPQWEQTAEEQTTTADTKESRQKAYEDALKKVEPYVWETIWDFYKNTVKLWQWNAVWATDYEEYRPKYSSILFACWLSNDRNAVLTESQKEGMAKAYLISNWIMEAWTEDSIQDWINKWTDATKWEGWTITITLSPYYQSSDDQMYSNWLETWKLPASIKNDTRYWATEEERENNFMKAAQSYVDRYTMYNNVYYNEDKTLYDTYLKDKLTDSQKKMIEASKKYWAMTWDRLDNFYKSAQKYSEEVVQPQQAKVFQESLDLIVELKNQIEKEDPNALQKTALKWIEQPYWLWNSKMNSIRTLYQQIKSQAFIDKIIDSKSKWASYWPLSDNEWNSIRSAATNLSFKNINDEENWTLATLNIMIADLAQAITELWYTPDITTWRQRNLTNIIENWSNKSIFNQTWSAYTKPSTWTNFTWQVQTWLVNTGVKQQWQ